MKIYELVEQTVTSIGPGGQTPIPTTSPTQGPPTTNQPPSTANTATNATQMGQQPTNPQNMSNIRNNAKNMGGDPVDTNAIAAVLANPDQLTQNASLAKKIVPFLKVLRAGELNQATANTIKQGVTTAVNTLAANDPQYKQVAESLKRLVESLKKLQ
jgi:hypothetical protein